MLNIMTALSPRQIADAHGEARISRPAGAGYGYTPGSRRPAPFGAIARGFAALAAGLREHMRRQQVVAELSRLSDHELADIGLNRADIGQVFEPEFAIRRNPEHLT
jgi:uncharacterized protein YjiS (DUF1127 family)